MSADSPRRSSGGGGGGSSGVGTRGLAVPATVPPQVVSDRSILDSAIGFINDVTLVHQPITDPKDTITWARFETAPDVSDPRFGEDWELEGNAAPPLLLILGYGLGVQVWAIPANGEAVEVLSWRHGVVSALRILPTPTCATALDENGRADEPIDAFAEKRPLIALVDGGVSSGATGAGGGGGGGGIGISGGISLGAQPQFCAVNFVSLKTGSQVKTIKFKNPVLDILANRSAIAITFHERIAVFDARTLEDRLTITTCYPSPGINPNPVAMGPRWLAYAEHKVMHTKRSGGGCDGEGASSYTATVINAAKSLSKGLRELGEHVAAGLTGSSTAASGSSSKNNSFDSTMGADAKQPGIVTIIDIKNQIKDYSPTSGTPTTAHPGTDPVVAHFIAHTEAIVAMEFDSSGMLLLVADKRGHDFHVFRVQPHPVGASLAAVHHLYVLHRGDTSAKVQNIAFSLDSRWVAVSTLRGTTHVFPITPYGGAMGVRTHTSLHVVNKLSRFHRSAGLSADGRSSSPISHSESTTFVQSLQPYHNPTLPPFPRPTVVQPLAQLRQPFTLGSPPGSAGLVAVGGKLSGVGGSGGASVATSQRQRHSSLSDDSGKPLSVCSIFAKSRSWLLEPPNATREAPHRIQRKAVDSLFVMAGHGALIQYDLDTKLASNVAKEKICDDTAIELEVEAKAQWNLGRRKDGSQEIVPPLALDNWLIKDRHASMLLDSAHHFDDGDDRGESWLSQVEIITHAGPHRRLWMGPQFVFKVYNTPSGSNLNHVDAEAVEIGVSKSTSAASSSSSSSAATTTAGAGVAGTTTSLGLHGSAVASTSRNADRSSPLNMPLSATGRGGVPVLIESGSYSSIEQSPKLMDRFRHGHLDSDFGHGDTRLKEDLADAMRESPSVLATRRDNTTGRLSPSDCAAQQSTTTTTKTTKNVATPHTNTAGVAAHTAAAAVVGATANENAYFYDALAEHTVDEDDESNKQQQRQRNVDNNDGDDNTDEHDVCLIGAIGGAAAPAAGVATTFTYSSASATALARALPNICSYDQNVKIEKIVNPLGTVTTVTAGRSSDCKSIDVLDDVVDKLAAEECVIHENCDESLFRPVVAIFCDAKDEQERRRRDAENLQQQEHCRPPVVITNKLIVPVIAKEVDEKLTQKKKQQQQQQKCSNAAAVAAAAKQQAASQQLQRQQLQQQRQQQKEALTLVTEQQRFDELSNLNKRCRDQTKVLPTLAHTLELQTTLAATTTMTTPPTTTTTTTTLPSTAAVAAAKGKSTKDMARAQKENKNAATATAKIGLTLSTSNVKAKATPAADEKSKQEQQKTAQLQQQNTKTAMAAAKRILSQANVSETAAAAVSVERRDSKVETKYLDISNLLDSLKDINDAAEEGDGDGDNNVEGDKSAGGCQVKAGVADNGGATAAQLSKKNKNNEKKQQLQQQLQQPPPNSSGQKSNSSSSETESKLEEASSSEDLADKLLADRFNIAAVMVSSAKAQGLKLIVETPDAAAAAITTTTTTTDDEDEDVGKGAQPKLKPKSKQEELVEQTQKSDGKQSSLNKSVPAKPPSVEQPATTKKQTSPLTPQSSKEKDNGKKTPASSREVAEQQSTKTVYTVKVVEEDARAAATTATKSAARLDVTPSKKAATKDTAVAVAKKLAQREMEEDEDEDEVDLPPIASPLKVAERSKQHLPPPPPPLASAWKGISSGANILSKAMSSESSSNFPSLASAAAASASSSANKKPATQNLQLVDDKCCEKLLPELPTPKQQQAPPMIPSLEFKEPSSKPAGGKKSKKFNTAPLAAAAPSASAVAVGDFSEFLLDECPPLPALQSLEELTKSMELIDANFGERQTLSLINFESPLQEKNPPAMQRKITPPPRGFNEENLIFALCGSLHYEHEAKRAAESAAGAGSAESSVMESIKSEEQKAEVATATAAETTKSFAIISEPQSSSTSLSTNSSGSEEIIVVGEPKKLNKKHKRSKQQLDMQKQRELQQQHDEELRPLISMSDSQLDNNSATTPPRTLSPSTTAATSTTAVDDLLLDASAVSGGGGKQTLSKRTSAASLAPSSTTTTDSEGPIPATTSDDNVYTCPPPANSTAATQHKLKTKKLEHKINLIAAIEAATSSSTSSAEDSSVETTGGGGDAAAIELDGSVLVGSAGIVGHGKAIGGLSAAAAANANVALKSSGVGGNASANPTTVATATSTSTPSTPPQAAAAPASSSAQKKKTKRRKR